MDSGNPARSGSELGSEYGLGSKQISAACNHICPQNNSEPVADATVLDGAVMVQVLNNGTSRTFQDYTHSVCTTHRWLSLLNLRKVNALTLCGMYLPTSLKA